VILCTIQLIMFRAWDRVCVVMKGNQIFFYKDQKSYRSAPEATFRLTSFIH
jgi:hypothetical protein